jgi:hypothetical protein
MCAGEPRQLIDRIHRHQARMNAADHRQLLNQLAEFVQEMGEKDIVLDDLSR